MCILTDDILQEQYDRVALDNRAVELFPFEQTKIKKLIAENILNVNQFTFLQQSLSKRHIFS